ncbi:uncharacterized protein [Asterias amurensis]|uniref:uncharacterized protein n=1 Tax=Asterias amurensis TaxID=7602 RepID=UPI003AB5C75F
MSYEESPEPIDFDFFAEDDEDVRSTGRNSSRHTTPLTTGGAAAHSKGSRPVSASSRPVSASSARSLSSRSSISVKIPSAGPPTGVRENAYTFKSRYSDSSDEDYYAVNKGSRYDNRNKVEEPTKDAAVNRSRDEDGSGGEGDAWKKASSSRPKTSKGPRSGRANRQRDRSSSSDSKSSKSSRHSSSTLSSKSEHTDSYTSVSDSDSDVTDVSPLPSPARSPTPRLEYDQDDFEDSFEETRFRQAKEQSSSTNDRQNKKRNRKKESVRFAAVAPNNGSTSQRDKELDATEARELSRLLRAVLQLEETPNHSQMNSYHRSPTKQRPSSAKRAPTSTSTAAMPHQRVNLSFSNDKVRQIDRENQRLLQKILRRPKSAVTAPRLAPPARKQGDQSRMTSHSAIRRQREQRKIEAENRKILERIESAHASSAMQRTSLLHDHDRHMKYASQVSKGSMRPTSSRNTGHNYSGSLSKGSSLASLNSEASRTSTASTGSRRTRPSSGRSMPPPPQGPRQAWEDRW